MMMPQTIASLPLWLAGLVLVGAALLYTVLVALSVRRLVPLEVRADHDVSAAAIFSVIGTTYAVLLAFVAMLAWEGFNKAQSVTDAEASLVLNVYQLVDGLSGPERDAMRGDIVGYARSVLTVEWPAQAAGVALHEEQPDLAHLTRIALHLRPGNIADGNLHTLLLGDLAGLAGVRRERLLIQRTPIPPLVWFVLLAGGGLSVAFSSVLGARSLRMHLAMSSLLALSGSLVLLLIVAFSNPFRGDLRVSSEPFGRVLMEMSQPA